MSGGEEGQGRTHVRTKRQIELEDAVIEPKEMRQALKHLDGTTNMQTTQQRWQRAGLHGIGRALGNTGASIRPNNGKICLPDPVARHRANAQSSQAPS